MERPKVFETLESDKTPKNEMVFVKKKGGKWAELAGKREVHTVDFSMNDLNKATENGTYSMLHTHHSLEPNTPVSEFQQIEDDFHG